MMIQSILDRPIAYHRCFVQFGGINCAVFLSQALYWHFRTSHPGHWFWKTADEWESETGLTRRMQTVVREKLCELNILEEELRGVPARLWYRVKITNLEYKLKNFNENASFNETAKP